MKLPQVEKITTRELREYVASNETLIVDALDRPAMMASRQGEMIKLFFPKRRFSSTLLFPKALRFAKNGLRLKPLGIAAPYPKRIISCPERKTHIVVYDRLPGEDLRQLVLAGNDEGLDKLPHYLARLHELGVYFRGIHLGNILWSSAGRFGLIDIAGMNFKSAALGFRHRVKNLAHLLNTRNDYEIFDHFGRDCFLDQYGLAARLESCKLADLKKNLLAS